MNDKQMSSDTSSLRERLDNSNCHQRAGNVVAIDNNGNGNGRQHRLIHSVSIIVEPVLEDVLSGDSDHQVYDHRGSPVVLLENFDLSETQGNSKSTNEEDIVKSIIATARLRREEFARILAEHAELVKKINRVETSLL